MQGDPGTVKYIALGPTHPPVALMPVIVCDPVQRSTVAIHPCKLDLQRPARIVDGAD